jgi:hypothetical protein
MLIRYDGKMPNKIAASNENFFITTHFLDNACGFYNRELPAPSISSFRLEKILLL